MNESVTQTSTVVLSERAGRQIAKISAAEPAPIILRVSVEGGGCSGFQYKFDLITQTDVEPDDLVIERGGGKVVIDQISLEYMADSEIDFVDDLIGASFQIKNPNATASCGCGTSFSM